MSGGGHHCGAFTYFSTGLMDILLPNQMTYLPGAGRCIYCCRSEDQAGKLTREHIIPRKLRGALVLHKASCDDCAKIINREIETPILTQTWLSARTFAEMPTSRPREELPIGRINIPDRAPPPGNLNEAGFHLEQLPVSDFPFRVVMPIFAPPGILERRDEIEGFEIRGVSCFSRDGDVIGKNDAGETAIEMVPFDPSVIARQIMKIAHGAAIAELGFDAFKPFLPPIILGETKRASHFFGSARHSRIPKNTEHEIRLSLRDGFVVATVGIFAKYASPYIVVVGEPSSELAKWHMSSAVTLSAAPQRNARSASSSSP